MQIFERPASPSRYILALRPTEASALDAVMRRGMNALRIKSTRIKGSVTTKSTGLGGAKSGQRRTLISLSAEDLAMLRKIVIRGLQTPEIDIDLTSDQKRAVARWHSNPFDDITVIDSGHDDKGTPWPNM